MKQIFFSLLILFLSVLPAQAQQDEQRGVALSGSIQTDVLVPQEDEAIEADGYSGRVLSNTYADLLLTSRYVDAGLRMEYMEHPLPGFDPDFDGWGLAHLFVTAHAKNLELRAGDFYEQFGSGLTLRAYEQRHFGIDNSLRGGRLHWQPAKAVSVKMIAGRQRRYWKHNKAWITGADVEVGLDQWLPSLRRSATAFALGASALNRHGGEADVVPTADETPDLPKNVALLGLRASMKHGPWEAQAEWACKTADPNSTNGYARQSGQALFLMVSYQKDSLSLRLQARRSDNATLSCRPYDSPLSSMVNHQPALIQEHELSVPFSFPYITQGDGEWAARFEASYSFASHTALGGAYGSSVKLSFSHAHSPGQHAGFWSWGSQMFYQDLNLVLRRAVSPTLELSLMYMNQYYNQTALEGAGGMMHNDILVATADQMLSPRCKLRAEAQCLLSNQQVNDEYLGLLRLSVGSHWAFEVSDEYYPHDGQTHYPAVAIDFSAGAHALSVSYGRFSSGFDCTEGIARFVPSLRGLTLSYSYDF